MFVVGWDSLLLVLVITVSSALTRTVKDRELGPAARSRPLAAAAKASFPRAEKLPALQRVRAVLGLGVIQIRDCPWPRLA